MAPKESGAIAASRKAFQPRYRGGPSQIDFPPIRNGVDYLVSVIQHLDAESGTGPREIRYRVLHLHAAAEVLLKSRLLREPWSLVESGKAPLEAFVPQTHHHGMEAEVDFGDITVRLAGELVNLLYAFLPAVLFG